MDQDGGLRLHLQAEPPATGHEANWLPTSGAHPWFLILRLYRPQPAVIDAAWGCPAITRATWTSPRHRPPN